MGNNNYILTDTHTISSLDADFKESIRISALVNHFIQAAWKHAEILGLGLKELNKLNYSWVLSQLKIKLVSIPKWPGEVKIETWPKGINRLFYLRDAKIFDCNNNHIASITSSWLIIDKQSKRPKLITPDNDILTHHQDKHAINEIIAPIKIDISSCYEQEHNVRYSDIDINQHLTTVRYIDYVFDSYNLAFFNTHIPQEITFNFLKEVKFGTNLKMQKFEKGQTHHFELSDYTNKTLFFRAKITY